MQQMLWLKVYTNRDRSPELQFQPQPWLTQFLARAVRTCHPAVHQVKLRLQVKCKTCLWEPKLSVSWLISTFTKARQKWQRSLFICLRLRRWFSQTTADALLRLSEEEQNRVKNLPVLLQICRGRLSLSADSRGWHGALRFGGASPMHRHRHPVAALCHPGQRAARKCHFLTSKAPEKTELALSKEQRCLHSALTSAGKNTTFINSAKRQPKHNQLNLLKLP